jgi:hypothetical protein
MHIFDAAVSNFVEFTAFQCCQTNKCKCCVCSTLCFKSGNGSAEIRMGLRSEFDSQNGEGSFICFHSWNNSRGLHISLYPGRSFWSKVPGYLLLLHLPLPSQIGLRDQFILLQYIIPQLYQKCGIYFVCILHFQYVMYIYEFFLT